MVAHDTSAVHNTERWSRGRMNAEGPIVELIRFNGDGTVDVPGGRISVNGSIFPTVATETYTIASLTAPNKGCEGSLTFPGVRF
jgi:hypothetical protein